MFRNYERFAEFWYERQFSRRNDSFFAYTTLVFGIGGSYNNDKIKNIRERGECDYILGRKFQSGIFPDDSLLF